MKQDGSDSSPKRPHDPTSAMDSSDSPDGLEGLNEAASEPSISASDLKDSLLNERIGTYRIQQVLGAGGFGTVYKAWDDALDRQVAIKFMKHVLSDKARAMFEREAKAIAALSKHPSIVDIYQWGEYRGQCYFVLEYVESNAEQLLEENPEGLTLIESLRITMECAEALYEAHQQGIIHRDIKPANILLEPKTHRAKITDFGLARLPSSSDFTIEGDISGSPPYMSPEQADGDPLDARSDVFSLGVTLYELICGKRPFEAASVRELLRKIRVDDRIPLGERRPDLPQGILELVDKAIAHKPEQRFQTMGEFARQLRLALQAIERQGKVPSIEAKTPPEPPKRHPWRWAVLVMAALLITTAILLVIRAFILVEAPERRSGMALAKARDCLEKKDLECAEREYRQLLDAYPKDADVSYGLGMTLLREGNLEEAAATFMPITDPLLRAEGEAALAFEKDGAAAEAVLQGMSSSGSQYLRSLRAQIAALKEEYEQSATLLKDLKEEAFQFKWQYGEALQTLGQAYYHLGKLGEAKTIFEQLAVTDMPEGPAVAKAYSAEIARRLDDTRREQVRESVHRICQMMDTQPPEEVSADSWTSRALSFFVLPVEAKQSRFALESGLTDLLPQWLGERLDEATPMKLVDRELISEILSEQELSGMLSSGANRLRLGQIVGARLVVQCRIVTVDGQEKLIVKIDDVETSIPVAVPALDLERHGSTQQVVADAAGAIWRAVARAYPVRGRLYQGAKGPEVNVGMQAGAQSGMHFDVFPDPDVPPISEASAVVEMPGGATALVTLSGVDLSKLGTSPGTGWYVQERLQEK
ncbi:MAG TPA: protein kinase [Candidatus Hydrogenedentes bacterium]|nr:protein kinase [Candidatus Hydrogenedentota bacterium]